MVLVVMPLNGVKTKFLWLFLGLMGLLLLWRVTPVQLLFDHDALIERLHMTGWAGICWFILAHVLATVVGLPGTILVIAGGAVYGVLWGTVWSVIGATLGAIAAFWVVRYLLHDFFEHRFGHHPALKRLKSIIHHHALHCVLTIRFMPISPFNLVNFLFGLTPIGLKPYIIGTVLGIIPGTAIYTWIGMSGAKALHGDGVAELLIALAALAFLAALPILVKRSRC